MVGCVERKNDSEKQREWRQRTYMFLCVCVNFTSICGTCDSTSRVRGVCAHKQGESA